MSDFEELDFELDVKSIDDGHIEGLAVGYGNLDHGGDIVMPGAITASIAGRKSIPMLLHHDKRRQVGGWHHFEETADGLFMKGRFSNTRAGQEAREDVKSGALPALSMGFKAVRHKIEQKARKLFEVALFEVSLVPIGMNDKTLVTGVKAIGDIVDKLRAGVRLQEREWDDLLKKQFDFSNAEAERAVRINLKGQGDPGGTATDDVRSFFEALSA